MALAGYFESGCGVGAMPVTVWRYDFCNGTQTVHTVSLGHTWPTGRNSRWWSKWVSSILVHQVNWLGFSLSSCWIL